MKVVLLIASLALAIADKLGISTSANEAIREMYNEVNIYSPAKEAQNSPDFRNIINGTKINKENLLFSEETNLPEYTETDDMEVLLGRSRWCRKRGGMCRTKKRLPNCPKGYDESEYGKPYCMGRERRCCYPEGPPGPPGPPGPTEPPVAAVCTGGCGNGKCTSPGTCTCNNGYTGDKCQIAAGDDLIAGQYLTVSEDKVSSWNQAMSKCKALGARLAVIADPKAFHTYLYNNYRGKAAFYLGASDIATEGTWKWINGEPLYNFPWAPGEPNDVKYTEEGEDCLSWSWDNYNDMRCNHDNMHYVCEHTKKWTKTVKACIKGHNNKEITGPTFDDCKLLCEKETSFICLSVDYYPPDKSCQLSTDDNGNKDYMEPCYSPYTEYNIYSQLIQEMALDEIDFSLPKTGQTSVHCGDCTADEAFFNSSTFWHSNHGGTPQALWISFANPVSIKKFSFQSRTDRSSEYYLPDADGPSKYVFFGSNSADCSDSSSWITLFEDDSGTPFTTANTPKTELVPGERSFSCYGFNVKEVPGRSNQKTPVTMANIKLYTTGLQEMDLNTIGVGATSQFNDHERKENAFGKNGSHWQSEHGIFPKPSGIWYKFPAPVVIAKFSFRSRNDGYAIDCGPTSYEFFGSNSADCSDQSSWVTLFQDLSDTPFTMENIPKSGYVYSPAPYLCYGFKILKISHQPFGSAMSDIRFFSPRN